MKTVTFARKFAFKPKLAKGEAWKSTVAYYKAGQTLTVEDAVAAAAEAAGALEAPSPAPVTSEAPEPQEDADSEGA